VFKLYTEVILDKSSRDDYLIVELQRSALLRQQSLLETTDFGAGAHNKEYRIRFRKVKDITRGSSISPKLGKLIYRLIEYSKPDDILEVGTSMGISSMYMAKAAPDSRIITMEGCAMIAEKAMENFNSIGLKNIELVMGNFDLLLEKTLRSFEKIDFVLIDGNHRKDPTLAYFRQILPKLHSGSMIMIDDIHWSKGMEQAWEEIRANEKVSISIDLFSTGILIFKEDIAKEDFVLKF